jgi:erythromycin esterase-like protein
MDADTKHAHALNACIGRLTGAEDDYDELMLMIGRARFVLIGGSTLGTHEFYEQRNVLTCRLIAEKDFMGVAVDADWQDAARVNRYLHGDAAIDNATDALSAMQHFPGWLWRNTETRNMLDWLYGYNRSTYRRVPEVGFYGLDFYGLQHAAAEALADPGMTDAMLLRLARQRFGCFEPCFGPQSPLPPEAASACGARLAAIQRRRFALRQAEKPYEEELLAQLQARMTGGMDAYCRALMAGRTIAWNARATHLMETLEGFARYLTRRYERPVKLVIWTHNAQAGDARATASGADGEISLGQLLRERYGDRARLIGFTTHHGSVTAASGWDEPAQQKHIRAGVPGSIESLFHQTEIPDFLLNLRDHPRAARILNGVRPQRAIGAIYHPQEDPMLYREAEIAAQFDAVIHLDATRALHPLGADKYWHAASAQAHSSGP